MLADTQIAASIRSSLIVAPAASALFGSLTNRTSAPRYRAVWHSRSWANLHLFKLT